MSDEQKILALLRSKTLTNKEVSERLKMNVFKARKLISKLRKENKISKILMKRETESRGYIYVYSTIKRPATLSSIFLTSAKWRHGCGR